MRITFVTYIYPYPERGYNPGIERVVEEYARELVSQGHEIHVITTYRNGGIEKREEIEGVVLHRISDARFYLGRTGSVFSVDLLSLNYSIREHRDLLERSDIVHTFTPIVEKFFSTPLIAHYHHWDEPDNLIEYLYLPTSHRLWKRCFDTADTVTAVSEYSADDLAARGVPRSMIEVAYNGVDTERYSPGESSIQFSQWDTVLLYVGPLAERKGINYLLRAMQKITSEHPDTGLLLIGGGNQAELRHLARKLGVSKNVQFEGFVSEQDLPDYYRSADIFVFPSLLEGFGLVLVEAMASGLPIVSTQCTAIPEVVGDAGYLVPGRDGQALSEAINEIISNQSFNRLGKRSLRRVHNHFSWEERTKDLVEIYKNVDG